MSVKQDGDKLDKDTLAVKQDGGKIHGGKVDNGTLAVKQDGSKIHGGKSDNGKNGSKTQNGGTFEFKPSQRMSPSVGYI